MPLLLGMLLLGAVSGGVSAAGVQGRPLLSEADFLGEMPVVLSATRMAQPLSETPAATTIIDRQMIEATGARSIVDVFRLVPGLLVGYESGNRPAVTTHGFGDVFARRMQVLIDGRSVYVPAYGGVPWTDLPLALDDVERIEVVRGPNAASYGANSFLGIISITTRKPRDAKGTQARLTAGTQSIRDAVLRTGDQVGKLDYHLTVGMQQDDGFRLRHDRQQHQFLTTALSYPLGKSDSVDAQFGYSGGVNEKGSYDDVLNTPRDQQVISRFEQLRWQRDLGQGNNFSLQFYHNYNELDEQYTTAPIPVSVPPIPPFTVQIPINYDVTSERYDLELQNAFGISRDLRGVWGMGWRVDQVVSAGFLGTSARQENRAQRVFLNMEWHTTQQLTLNAGAMWEHDQIVGGDLSPRVALNYQLTSRQTLRASVSRATRNPVLVEERGNLRVCVDTACSLYDQVFLSSGGLEPETIESRDIGYFARVLGNLTLDARVYQDKLSGLIDIYPRPYPQDLVDSSADDFRNEFSARVNGLETQITYRPNFKDRIILGYAYTHIKSNEDRPNYSESAPQGSGSLLWMHSLSDRYQASLAYYYVGSMAFLDSKPVDPVSRLDLRLAHKYRWGKVGGDIALVMQSALGGYDEYYPPAMQANEFDRRMFISFGMNFR
jgi:iron complex outermembrane receptor protein